MKLIFIHGVGNAETPPETSARQWRDALIAGGVAGAQLGGVETTMAYYADLLDLGASKSLAADAISEDADRTQFVLEVAREIARAQARTVKGVVDLATKSGGGGNKALLAEAATLLNRKTLRNLITDASNVVDEIYDYATKPGLRQAIDERVATHLVSGPMLIIAHSLGSVVAYRLLRARDPAALSNTHFITMGSALRLAMMRNVIGGPFVYPQGLAGWLNVFDRWDAIPLLQALPVPNGGQGRFSQLPVNNRFANNHNAVGYLPTGPVVRTVKAQLPAP